MDVLVTYDVSTETAAGRRRLRKAADACLAFGQRVQKSVFECHLTEVQLEQLRHRLLGIINEEEDSLRIYRLPKSRQACLSIYGRRPDVDYQGPLIV
jgi:CRISPR-associated protein Cas2